MKEKLIVIVVCLFSFFFLAGARLGVPQVTVYVSSSEGNDSNDGTSPEKPVKTINNGLKKGKTVMLKAGDVFYETLNTTGHNVGRYGEGGNPTLCGYKRIVKPKWEYVDSNVWRLNLSEDNFTGFNKVGPTLLNNIGCIHEYDKDLVHGGRRQHLKDLSRDWDFWQTERHEYGIDPNEFNYLYLYISCDPNKLKLEFSVYDMAAVIDHTTIESVNFVGFGYGLECKTNTIIRNCKIDAMGGRMWVGQNVYGSLGNGINFYVSEDIKDCLIEGNYISRCYDCGITIQAEKQYDFIPKNIIVQDNLITNCCQGWEDFLHSSNTYYDNCVFRNNIVLYSGESGFSYPESRFIYCHVLGYNGYGDKGMIFENNSFAKGNYYCGAPYNRKYRSNVWRGNTCYLSDGNFLIGQFRGEEDVIRVKKNVAKSSREIDKYRELTGDYTTVFRILPERKVIKKAEQLKNEYLKTHNY